MKEADTLQRFIFEHANIRGEIVHIEKTFQNIMNQRDYPPMVKNLLGEALVSCLLLASSIKFEGNLSLQFQGDERLSLLLVQCDHNLNIRGFAKCAEGLEIADYATAFLQGRMVITLSQDNQSSLSKPDTYSIHVHERKSDDLFCPIRTNCYSRVVSCQ